MINVNDYEDGTLLRVVPNVGTRSEKLVVVRGNQMYGPNSIIPTDPDRLTPDHWDNCHFNDRHDLVEVVGKWGPPDPDLDIRGVLSDAILANVNFYDHDFRVEQIVSELRAKGYDLVKKD